MKNYTKLIVIIRDQLRQYIVDNDLKSLIIGISGGIDSLLCAALAGSVCREKGIPLIGRSIPIKTNTEEEIDRALTVGELFCDDFYEQDLSGAFGKLIQYFPPELDNVSANFHIRIRSGNIKARIRMMVLYDLAKEHNGLVLSTDNLSEYYLGFWTLHGDHADYGMIQNLWKTEIYELAECFYDLFKQNDEDKKANIFRAAIDAVPTDGLGVSASDCEQFGVPSYNEVDETLKEWLKLNGKPNSERTERLRNSPVVKMHESTHFKRNWPISISRERLETCDAAKRALIIVDLLKDFMPGGTLAVKEGDLLAEKILEIRDKFDIVIFIQDWHPKDHCSFIESGGPWPEHCVQNSKGAEIDWRVYRKGDIVVLKGLEQEVDSYSGFWDNDRKNKTGLEDILRKNNINTTYICGLATDYCVKFTALDSVDAGFKTFLLSEMCRGVDIGTGDSERAIEEMADNGVTIIP